MNEAERRAAGLGTEGPLHLVNDIPATKTLCGIPIDEIGENWTDAIYEIVAEPKDDSVCHGCHDAGAKLIAQDAADDAAWRREIAIEAGMLHGVEAYNEALGNG